MSTFVGVQLAQLAIGVLGVLVISGEYSTGMIRSSMCAVPRRVPVLWAKAAVYALVTLALMLPASVDRLFRGPGVPVVISTSTVAFSAPGVAAPSSEPRCTSSWSACSVVGLGAITSNTAGGIATFAGIMFVLPPLMNVLPSSWNHAASPYLPLAAGEAIMSITPGDHLSPWVGLALFAGYALVTLAVAAFLMLRRDT